MPDRKATPVSPYPRYSDYVYENLGVFEYDSDQMIPSLEEDFCSRADINEGVSGLKAIDTTYENTSQDIVDRPRSAVYSDDPTYPMDLDRYPHRRY